MEANCTYTERMKRRFWIWTASLVLLILGFGYVATSVEAYTSVAYICENTGSRYGYHLWPGGFKTSEWARKSFLESFLVESRPKTGIQHRWSRCAYMGTTIFGNHISFADGPLGGMAYLSQADLAKWMEHHSQAEVVGLYDFLCKSNREESRKRVDEIRRELYPYG